VIPTRRPLLALLIASSVLTGCDGWTTTDGPSDPPGPQPGGEPAYGGIPDDTDRLVCGSGTVRAQAPVDGRIWIGNDTERYQVFTQPVRRGDKVEVDPKNDRVKVNGTVVYNQNLESKDQHTVFFRGSGSWHGGDVYGGIPNRAERVACGRGDLSYRVEYDGRIWIGDDKDKRVLHSCDVRRDDKVEIDIDHDQLKINGRVVYNQNLESKHQHSIFLQ
jgi:hypothetical protein